MSSVHASSASSPSKPQSLNIAHFTNIRSTFKNKSRKYHKKSTKKKFSIPLLNGCCFKAQKTLSPHNLNIVNNQNNEMIYPISTTRTTLALSSTEPALSTKDELQIESSLQSTSNNKLINDTLSIHGYSKKKEIAPTLQGSVFLATKTRLNKEYLLISGYISFICNYMDIDNDVYDIYNIYDIIWRYYEPTNVVIKTAEKSLHFAGVTIKDGKRYLIQENIVKEARLMQLFSNVNNNVPSTMIKYYDFFEDDDTFYLVMEKGGIGLFEFTVNAHQMIKNNKLDIKYWRKCVKFIFAKMVGFIAWMHKEVNCCNLDISLENIVMTNNTKFDEKSGKFENLDIRFIDFGLTEKFNQCSTMNKFKCKKFVGKTGYKAPKVLNKKPFMANKADIWCLGISLFMISIGAPPFLKASINDPRYVILRDGQLKNMVYNWGKWKYVTSNQFDLIEKMLQINEENRYSIDDVISHKWLKVYFGQYLVKRPCIAESTTNTFQCDHGEYIANLE